MTDDNPDREQFRKTFQRAQTCVKNERYAVAREILLPAVKRWPHISVLWGFLGCTSEELGLDVEALECLRKARDLKPDSEIGSLALIDLLWNHGDHAELIDEVARFLSIQDSKEHRNWAINLTDYLKKTEDSPETLAYAIDKFVSLDLETD